MSHNIVDILQAGGVVVMPTDTIYGLCAQAKDRDAVERVYALKGRDYTKPCIILLADMSELSTLGIEPMRAVDRVCQRIWPGAVSSIFTVSAASPAHLTRGGSTLACRVPDNTVLRDILKETGPLIAPSANPQGMEPARTIEEAQAYFGSHVDMYSDGGYRTGKPSTLIDCTQDVIRVVREGVVDVTDIVNSVNLSD